MSDSFDVIVIGAGPAGYVAAIRSSQLGLNTACIDAFTGKDGKPALGGTCLNVGCIPSKALLDSSKHFHQLQHGYAEHGISARDVAIDVAKMIARKDKIVRQLTGGITTLFKANKITSLHGHGKLLKDREVEFRPADGGPARRLKGQHVILASGSLPIEIPGVPFDGEYIIDNVGALDLDAVPPRLGVIGAGVIGLEMGSVWKRLGSEVVLLEAMSEFLGVLDRDIARVAMKEFSRQGLDIRLGCKVAKAEIKGRGKKKEVVVSYHDGKEEQQLIVDRLLVAVGRRANTKDLLTEDCGVKLNPRGQIEVDDACRTAVENVWAIGDCVRGPMLAHKGSEEGIAVAERIATGHGHIDFDTIPWVIYTEPEIAWVGKTEAELKAADVPYKVGSFPFAATGRALAMNEPAGMVKLIAHAETDRLLGAQMIGANVSELIAETVVTMEFAGAAEDLARICHAHPTLSEAIHEAALAVDKRAIHRAN